ncbi:CoA transferase [Sporichthya polymorpha]|uniref:CoA transferase n=1 Tax=Sporichthya polymorpha TaxID=35751 RepID=UPI00036C5D3D|nr:CoA transferase [Sporichthya polymorpha]
MLPGATTDRVADWLASGVAFLTGRQAGPPLVPPGAAATLARELGEQLADVGVGIDGAALLAERAAFTGGRRQGSMSVGGSCRLLPTADGWAAVSCARPDDPLLLGALVGAELPADPWPAVADWLAVHSGADLAERASLLGVAAAPIPRLLPRAAPFEGGGRARPAGEVAGRLVVDFSALWAGPLCAHLLGLAGARVVKVETPTRPDGARRGNPDFYRLLHAGHRSVVADPHDRDGRRFLTALVEAADVVIEASRPRALASWGLTPESTDATWVSITAAGRASNRVGFGDDVAAGAGLVAGDAAGPVFVGDAIADPLAGLTAAVRAVTAAPGELVEVDMTAVVAATLTGGESAVVTEGAQPPRTRPIRGEAPDSGADTDAVRRELGC